MCELFFISLGKCYYFCPFLSTIPWDFYICVCMCVYICIYTNMFDGFPKVSENSFYQFIVLSLRFPVSHTDI